ncbi:MAG TPA: hypothetical protein VMB71_02475, partial [Acetobacteraceae bacterium]|nr:hypothetical protein [Acetobacteraceae bacterium]
DTDALRYVPNSARTGEIAVFPQKVIPAGEFCYRPTWGEKDSRQGRTSFLKKRSKRLLSMASNSEFKWVNSDAIRNG